MLTKGPIPYTWLPYMRIIEFVAVFIAIVAFGIELSDRDTDRAVRRVTMLATIKQVADTVENKTAQNPVVPILETLVHEKLDLSSLSLPNANLRLADLGEAKISRSNLYRAILKGADLSGADLSGAVLVEAELSEADLSGADLSFAMLSGAKFDGVKNLTQRQLDSACLYKLNQPLINLPDGLKPPTKVCGLFTRK